METERAKIPNHKIQITNSEKQMITKGKFDLKDRTFKFTISVIALTRKLPKDSVNPILINQLIRSATSIGANYEEAMAQEVKKNLFLLWVL